MRLLVDARVGWGHGIGRVVSNTLPLIGQQHPDWTIDVLIEPQDIAVAKAAFGDGTNIKVITCDIPAFSVAEQLRLHRYARDYDLTWFTNYWVPINWRTPFVSMVHDMLHLMPKLFPASLPKRILARLTFAKLRRRASAVMFVSRYTEQAFVDMIGTPARSVSITLGSDHLRYPPRVTVRDRTRRLLVVAASKKHKNFPMFLAAWQQARVPSHWRLTIVTPNDAFFRSSIDLDALADAAEPKAGRVEVRRGIDNRELADLYADSAILLMPSLHEGFGLPLVEGMAAGALCVSSSAGAMVEVAQGGLVFFVNGMDRAGWTLAIEQSCALVDDDQVDLETLVTHNLACASRFRWADTARDIAATLASAATVDG